MKWYLLPLLLTPLFGLASAAEKTDGGGGGGSIRGAAETTERKLGHHYYYTPAPTPSPTPPPTTLPPGPCGIPLDQARQASFPQGLKPSYLANCIRSIPVDKDLMLMHINSINGYFREYDVFYNLANNPASSNPMNFQPELGYTLFAGADEGIANLNAQLTALAAKVTTQGANLGTFYELQTIFNTLRDAHIGLGGLVGDIGELMATVLYALPVRSRTEAGFNLTSWKPTFNANGALEVKVVFTTATGPQPEETVTSIGGKSVAQWYFDIASDPRINLPYQTIGGRMNKVYQIWQPETEFGINVLPLQGTSMPPDVLPDTFAVTFASGRVEQFVTAAFLEYPSLGPLLATAERIHADVNGPLTLDQPGFVYANYNVSIGRVEDAKPSKDAHLMLPPATTVDVEELDDQNLVEIIQTITSNDQAQVTTQNAFFPPGNYFWAMDFSSGEYVEVGAYQITNDYAVFKLWTFNFLFTCIRAGTDNTCLETDLAIPVFWSRFTQAAKAAGVKKAIIDVAQNGGGRVLSSDMLAVSLYPFVPFSYLQNQYDTNYNQAMLSFKNNILPLIPQIRELLNDLSDDELDEKIRHLGLTHGAGDNLAAIGDALYEYCCQGEGDCTTNPRSTRCRPLAELNAQIDLFFEFPTGPELRRILTELLDALPTYSPFRVTNVNIDPNVIRPVTRGGVQQTLSNRVSDLSPDNYNEAARRSFQNDFMFDSYTVIGDGTGGSATELFASKLMQLWNNRALMWNGRNGVTPASLTTVTFGGTSGPRDTAVAGFGTPVLRVNIGFPIIASGMLRMLEFLVPDDLSKQVWDGNARYQTSLITPPYFANAFPSTPSFSYYSRFMETATGFEAIPVQYVKMFSDHHFHIPQIYNSINGRSGTGNGADLAALYTEANRLQSLPTAAPTPAPTPSPTVTPDLLPVIAVADNTTASAAEIATSWITFRQRYPSRQFCLLQIRGFEGSNLNVPLDFVFDSNAVYKQTSRDLGNPFRNSNWFSLCGIQAWVDRGVTKFPVYIGFDDDEVSSSYELYENTIKGLNAAFTVVKKEDQSGGNWISPLTDDF